MNFRIKDFVSNQIFRSQITQSRMESEHLRRIAAALASSFPVKQMAEVVANELKSALEADAISVHLDTEDGFYEILAAIGCSEEWMRNWRRVPKDSVAFTKSSVQDRLYVGTAEQFKKIVPTASAIIDRSPRRTIAYAPLIVNNHSIGVIGFSYDSHRAVRTKENFILLLVDLCAQALERARLTEKETKAREAAEAANRAKSDFLANMSHEIRTPLGVIQGFADLLFEAKDISPEHRHWIATIRRNTNQLANIIGDVLDMAKIEAKKIEIEKVNFRLPDLLAAVCESATFQANAKHLAFSFTNSRLPEVVQGDPTRLRQILENLICNAVKFTVSGGISMQARFTEPNVLEVDVRDTGIGLEKDAWEKIFEPFTQAHSSTPREFGGTGLGLAICRRLAQSMGGTVTVVTSEPGQGSTFRVRVKCEAVSYRPKGTNNVRNIRTQTSEPVLLGAQILLVEDSADNRELIGHMLSREGAIVECAPNAETGIQKALGKYFDVVLMDIQMPGLNGYEAAARLRRSGYTRPIAALSACAFKSDLEKGSQIGFDDYFTKPIDRELLIRRLGQLRAGRQLH